MKTKDTLFYFPILPDCSGFRHLDTKGEMVIDHLVGEWLAHQLCDRNAIELVRLRIGSDVVIAMRRMNDVRVIVQHRIS